MVRCLQTGLGEEVEAGKTGLPFLSPEALGSFQAEQWSVTLLLQLLAEQHPCCWETQ